MIRAVLFDLGGVLERVDAGAKLEAWTSGRIPSSLFWERWLSSSSVREFESGKIGAGAFASRVVPELGLSMSADAFLDDFRSWLSGPFEGVAELVSETRAAGFATASLSNSNEIHWPVMQAHQRTDETFDANFPSHLMGVCKPDPEAFREALRLWKREPTDVLFLDDNEVNCRGARSAGLVAFRVDGVAGARAALVAAGVLPEFPPRAGQDRRSAPGS
ncbi:MAG TPA: HAD family phosphatase [Fibrobacteria bacterium]|nr:HAD family phosphatase [Fibrobacteria bacterium]